MRGLRKISSATWANNVKARFSHTCILDGPNCAIFPLHAHHIIAATDERYDRAWWNGIALCEMHHMELHNRKRERQWERKLRKWMNRGAPAAATEKLALRLRRKMLIALHQAMCER